MPICPLNGDYAMLDDVRYKGVGLATASSGYYFEVALVVTGRAFLFGVLIVSTRLNAVLPPHHIPLLVSTLFIVVIIDYIRLEGDQSMTGYPPCMRHGC
ncbi:MAG: hypothetical protein J3Q66DRAFT_350890 [Benniella sp.]|nr:MAG: hypothetical protein J3Q66DRAFT_350890 [Benniella sp.]